MLYAEHLLAQWNSLRREGAVLRSLKKSLPATLHELYETLLETCHRRTASDHQELVKFLLHLVAYSFRPLILDEVTSLLRHLMDSPEFDVDEIPEAFTYFLRVGDPGSDAEARAKLQSQGGWRTAIQDLEKGISENSDLIYNDGRLPVKFQERSMRSFFLDAAKGQLHWSSSEAHRQIFLASAKLARPSPGTDGIKLRAMFQKYATHYMLQHWRNISPEEHSSEDRGSVMEALWALITDQHDYAGMIEWNGSRYQDIFGNEGFDKIAKWATLLDSNDGVQLGEGAAEWWQAIADDHRQALIPLTETHLKKLHQAQDQHQALTSLNSLISGLRTVSRHSFPKLASENCG